MRKPPFIGRARELEWIRRRNEGQMYLPLFVYGPEGCGKTTLFIEAVRMFNRWFGDGLAIYINAEEDRDPRRIFHLSENLDAVVDAVAESLGISLLKLAGRIVADKVGLVVEKIYLRSRGVDRVFVVVDEVVRSLGLRSVEGYAKSLYNAMNFRNESEPLYGKILNYVAITSEGRSRDLLSRHSYVSQSYIWNLSKEDYERLYIELVKIYSPGDPSRIPSFTTIWRLYGGNPRRLIELAEEFKWDIEAHIESIRLEKGIPGIVHIAREKNLVKRLREAAEDPDSIYRTTGMLRLARLLVEKNLIMELPRGLALGNTDPPVNSELGIGENWAWQVPVYRDLVLREIERVSST
ncbi:MAG TPA: ATP-binding protein [Sulfolobales archaeon]|nr:ATP-binding protein [Sulfolobales archaeon]